MKKHSGLWKMVVLLALLLPGIIICAVPYAAHAQTGSSLAQDCDTATGKIPSGPNAGQPCPKICMDGMAQFQSTTVGADMISEIFTIINKMIRSVESTFYNGIINNPSFQKAIGAVFVLYIAVYGVMILFNLASYRSGEVMNRLIKLSIVYALCTPGGWEFFAGWVQHPIIGGINDLITDLSNASAVSANGACSSAGIFSGSGAVSSVATGNGVAVSLSAGPMAMLYGPMTCIFAAKFMAAISSLLLTGFYGWLIALMLLWGLMEFAFMLLGAIATYVKSIVGLTFLFGLAPIFFAFYLFEKSRALTEGWLSMVVGFALQPVMIFAFLAFYTGILGGAVSTMFVEHNGHSADMCYVPFYNMPGLFSMYWWRFTNSSGAAGGQWIAGTAGGSALLGNTLPPPVDILSVMYFMVLASLGKDLSARIATLSEDISGGRGAGAVTGERVGTYLKNGLGIGRGGGGAGGAGTKPPGVPKTASILRPLLGGGKGNSQV